MPETSHQYTAYKVARETATKTQQVVMLYEEVIKCMRQAREAIVAKDAMARFELIEKATKIINGLQDSLDYDNGGDISTILYDFYQEIYFDLVHIQRSESLAVCDEVVTKLQGMLESWRKIDEQEAELRATAPATGSSPADGGDKNLGASGVEISA